MTIGTIQAGHNGDEEKYCLCEGDSILAWFDDFTTAAVVCRFIKSGRLEKAEYDLAVSAMKAFDGKGAAT